MNIVVTGGLGFLGHVLTMRLAEKGNQVYVVDNLSSSVVLPDFFSAQPNVHVSTTDVCEYSTKSLKIDQIFHLASPVGSIGVLEYPGRIGEMILTATEAALSLCTQHRATMVYVSSSEVYGRAGLNSEDDDCRVSSCNSPRLEYALGKRLAEATVANRLTAENLDYQVIRPFNIAGPRQNRCTGFVIPTFFQQAQEGVPLTVFGDGRQRRAFGHVDDIVDGILLAASSAYQNKVYNLGNPNNLVSIGQLAEKILELVGGSSKINYVDPKKLHGRWFEEAFEKVPYPKRANEELGWHPKYSLEDVLCDIWNHIKTECSISGILKLEHSK